MIIITRLADCVVVDTSDIGWVEWAAEPDRWHSSTRTPRRRIRLHAPSLRPRVLLCRYQDRGQLVAPLIAAFRSRLISYADCADLAAASVTRCNLQCAVDDAVRWLRDTHCGVDFIISEIYSVPITKRTKVSQMLKHVPSVLITWHLLWCRCAQCVDYVTFIVV